MSVSSTSATSMSDLASVLLRRFDTDRDGKLSGSEFGSLLTNMLGGASSHGTSGVAAGGAAATDTASAATRTRVGQFSGFDMTKLNDPAWSSFKYRIGRVLQFYPNTAEGLRQALPEIQEIVPGATITGTNGDKLDFGDYVDTKSGRIGVVDVVIGAGGPSGGTAWAWQPVE